MTEEKKAYKQGEGGVIVRLIFYPEQSSLGFADLEVFEKIKAYADFLGLPVTKALKIMAIKFFEGTTGDIYATPTAQNNGESLPAVPTNTGS
jgi:hypothetical protein